MKMLNRMQDLAAIHLHSQVQKDALQLLIHWIKIMYLILLEFSSYALHISSQS